MKHTVFVLTYCVPMAITFVVVDASREGVSFRTLGALLPALFLWLLAATGLDFIGIRGRYEKKTTAELAMRGSIAGLAFVALCAAAVSFFKFEVAFYSALLLSIALAPIALLAPFPRRTSK